MAPSRGLKYLCPILTASSRPYMCPQCLRHQPTLRTLTTTPSSLSGHNRWSKIKHDKARVDASKTRARSQYSQELALLSRLHGPDPTSNPRLADTIAKAKREGFPKDRIAAAIARGQGRSATGEQLESVVFEGVLPGNVGVMVECETSNRLRTMAGLKLWLKEAGGAASPCAYLFTKRGRVVFGAREGVGVDEALEAALEAGAEDVEEGEQGEIVVWSEPGSTKAVGEAVAGALGLQIKELEIVWCPNEDTKVGLSEDGAAEELGDLVDDLQQKDMGVQSVAMNVAQGNVGDEKWKDLVSRLNA